MADFRPQTILELGRQVHRFLDILETLIPHVQVIANEPDLVSFLTKLDWALKFSPLMLVAAWHLKTLKMQPVMPTHVQSVLGATWQWHISGPLQVLLKR